MEWHTVKWSNLSISCLTHFIDHLGIIRNYIKLEVEDKFQVALWVQCHEFKIIYINFPL